MVILILNVSILVFMKYDLEFLGKSVLLYTILQIAYYYF